MQRDAPHRPISDDDNIVSIHDEPQSDEEMASMVGHLEQHTEDSSADSAAEGSNHPSDSEMESDYEWESHHHSDPGSDHSSMSDDNSGSESGSSDDDGGDFTDMFKGKLRHSNIPKKPGHWKHSKLPKRSESWPSSSNWSRSRETKNQKQHHVASPDNMPNLDKPDRKKKKSDWRDTPSKSHSRGGHPGECAHDRAAHRLGEELAQKYADEDEERQSRSKKPKKVSSSRKETSATQDSSKENECERKRKRKEKKAQAQEAKLRVERERRGKEDKELARQKLLDQYRREKYSYECQELREYRRKHITLEQMESVNLDDHSTYLTLIRQDKSQYPHQNVMSHAQLIKQLKDHGMDEKANQVRSVIEKGLNNYALARMLPTNSPIIKPKYFIRVIQKKTGEVIDWQDGKHGEDQNISLHDLVSQMSMRRVNIKQNVTVDGHTYLTEIDARFCPFCNYHCSCHKTLNNHVQIHLRLLMFCGAGDCFYLTFDIKARVPHILEAHKDLG